MQHVTNGPVEVKPRRVINITSTEVTVSIAESLGVVRKVSFPPKRFVELAPAYALPQVIAVGRDPRPSVIDQLTGGRVVDEADPRAKDAVAAAAEYDKKLEAAKAELEKKMGGK